MPVRLPPPFSRSTFPPLMPSSPPESVNLAQLVRYQLTIDNMCSPDCLQWVRQELMSLGLVVDQLHVRGAEVATTHAEGPSIDTIGSTLQAGGYQLVKVEIKTG